MSTEDFYPWFVGAYGENHSLVEELVVEAMRDHFFWRRNFHPESQPPIPTSAQYTKEYTDFVARLKAELYRVTADLKQSVPFYSPRYIGHMSSDLLIPGLVGRIATLLYNPNNVSEDVAPATLEKELIVGEQLCKMMGYPLNGPIRAFGHMTSGGTVANYEGVRNLMASRLYPVAVGQAARDLNVAFKWNGELIRDMEPTRLANLGVTASVDLRSSCLNQAEELGVKEWVHAVETRRYEHMGLADFLRMHPELGRPRLLVPVSGHYSWAKSMKLLGLGTAQLVSLEVDSSMRMRIDALSAALEDARAAGDSVMAVIPILGTTEFGAIDPVDKVMELRSQYREKGFEFGVHLDAAWGGYLRSLFTTEDGTMRTQDVVAREFKYFPTPQVHAAFAAVALTDSATVDPHKLAFIPYPAGAYVARDRNIVNFVQQDAAYVFEPTEDDDARFRMLGQYILEGSKPGATVVSAYITHRTIPLHHNGFGKIIANSIQSCEMFFDMANEWAARNSEYAVLSVPFEPDANIACFALNPAGNTSVAKANEFARKVLAGMSTVKGQPVQNREFMVSSTKLYRAQHGANADDALTMLGLDISTFGEPGGDHLLVLRHTLMNPWLQSKTADGKNYIELYFEHLEKTVRALLAKRDS